MMRILDSILTVAESQEVHLEAPNGDNFISVCREIVDRLFSEMSFHSYQRLMLHFLYFPPYTLLRPISHIRQNISNKVGKSLNM